MSTILYNIISIISITLTLATVCGGYVAFRSRSLSKIKRNLLIFMTPTVIGANGMTGLEDQYSRLKETDEDARFAYKKDLVGNAKPRDQFHSIADIERARAHVMNGKPTPSDQDTSQDMGQPTAVEAAPEKPQPLVNRDIPPAASPQLRDEPPAAIVPAATPGLRD